MSQDDAYAAKKLVADRGLSSRIRKRPGIRDGYEVIITKDDGSKATVDSLWRLARLLDRWG